MRALIALLLLTPALVGCLGAGDDALEPSATGGAAGEVAMLPEGLEMAGAEVVSYNETRVVWRWEEVIGPGNCCVEGPAGNAVETAFDVPAGVPFAIGVNLTFGDSGPVGPFARVDGEDGRTICAAVDGDPTSGRPVRCATPHAPLDEPTRWIAHVDAGASHWLESPFSLELTLTTGLPEPASSPGRAGGPNGHHVVIGFADTGINPYHKAFRDDSPEAYQHPSTYIEGYPREAEALELTLDAPSYVEAIGADASTWASVEAGELYWIPGTRIVGAVMPDGAVLEREPQWFCGPVLDCFGHGTWVASRAASATYGLCADCNIVAVQGFREGFRWIAEQPWVDVSSNSWYYTEPGVGEDEVEERIARKPTFLNSGNGAAGNYVLGTPSTAWTHMGAPHAIVVGGHDNGRVALWPGTMPHVVADACPALADHLSLAGTYAIPGTSHSTPYAAGAAAQLILEARRILEDPRSGVRDDVLAEGSPGGIMAGPLADGRLTIDEVREVVLKTADPRPGEGPQDGPVCSVARSPAMAIVTPLPVQWATIPDDVPAYYFIGYGAVTPDTLEHAKRVLRGQQPIPERPVEDAFFALDQEVRKALVEVEP